MKYIFSNIIHLDTLFFNKLVRFNKKKIIYKCSHLLSRSADGHLYIIIGLILPLLDSNIGVKASQVSGFSFLIYFPIYFVLKNSIKRPRPFQKFKNVDNLIAVPDQFSFPSGHTACSFIMATTLSYFYPFISLYMFFWALMVGLSRVLLGVHYPGDVFVGILIGISCAYFGINLAL